MNLLSKIWRRMFRSQSTEDEAMPEQTPTAVPAASVSVAVAEHAAAKADLAVVQAASAAATVADDSPLSIAINPSVNDIDALKAAIAADSGAGRLSVIEAAPVEPKVNTDTMRDLLRALGHDIGDVWDDVVKLAKKAI